MTDYTHLHLHTEYSLLDGTNKIKELAKRLKELGIKSCAITDHGNMFGAIDFYTTMKNEGIKPIIGIETYLHNHEDLTDKSTRQRFHLCLYAKNEIGYKNLMYLSSQAYIDGFYYNPRINKKILREHSEGLICSSACLAGEVNFHLNLNQRNKKRGAKGYEAAKKAALEYKEIFGDDFYLEIMRHGINDQQNIDDDIIRIAKETGIKLIATNDAHYTLKENAVAQKIYVYISANKNYNEKVAQSILSEFYVKSGDEMLSIFSDIPEAVANTNEIVEKCNLEISLGNPTPPNFKFTIQEAAKLGLTLPNPKNEYDLENDSALFEFVCRKGLEDRLKFVPKEKHEDYKKRLELEINVINGMKFPGYMLIVADFINWAKDHDIPVGPGRGSAAGSLVSYAMKITDLDPLPYNLLFERFLNPERISMPDIDVDFCQYRRGEVIEYVIEKYGASNVAQVATFGKLLAKGVIRDVARVMGMPYAEADAMAKLIPDELGIKLQSYEKKGKIIPGAFEKEPKIGELISSNSLANEVWEHSCELEGLNRNPGMHAAGIVISNEPLWNKTPLWRQSDAAPGHYITQYKKDYLEDVDLIKFDFLGLKTLTVIDNAKKLIKLRFNKDIVWEQIDFNDKKTYETIQSGNTLGIFQIESDGMQNLSQKLRPDHFEDLIAMIALYRPGPLNSGMVDDFIDIKHGKKKMEFPFPELEKILAPTYGVIVYQEQVMQVVQEVGGFTLGGADLVRRAMSKKKEDQMLKMKNEYLEGARAKGFDERKADALFELIMKFAEYGFNKSHSAAYALITFQTAFLKTYYPAEFMAALISSESDNVDKVVKYIDEIKRLDMELLPPDINKSIRDFGVVSEGEKSSIIYGMGAIKGVGSAAIDNILEARKEGEFTSLDNFISRTDGNKVNKRVYEALIKSGAFDDFGFSRKMLLFNIEKITDGTRRLSEIKRNAVDSLFSDDEEFTNPEVHIDYTVVNEEFQKKILLKFEQEMLGIYVSGHPLDDYKESLKDINYTLSDEFQDTDSGSEILVIGKLESVNTKITKSGSKMNLLNVMDLRGNMEIIAFNEYQKLEIMSEDELDEPHAFKVDFSKDGGNFRLKLNDVLSLEDAKQGVKLKSSKLTQEEIDANREILSLNRTQISNISTISKPVLVVGKINNLNQRTAKSGMEIAFVNLADESANADFIAFGDTANAFGNINLDEVQAFKIMPPRDGQKPVINQLISRQNALAGNYNLKAARKFNNKKDDEFKAPINDYQEVQAPKIVKKEITGDLVVSLKLTQLNTQSINAIYEMAKKSNGDKRLIIQVRNELTNQIMIYETDFGVYENFGDLIMPIIKKAS